MQQKIRAEPGPVTDGGPAVDPRWVGTGWTVFNNKGKPVRQYEPFFTDSTGFEFGVPQGREHGHVLRPGGSGGRQRCIRTTPTRRWSSTRGSR